MSRRTKGKTPGRKRSLAAGAPEGADPISTASLIGANLTPLVGVLFFGWDAGTMVVLYWSENLIVGFYSILRMALASVKPEKAAAHVWKLVLGPFFCFHFGGFCAIHGVFVLAFFYPESLTGLDDRGWPGPLFVLGMGVSVASRLVRNLPPGAIWTLASLFVSHGVSFVENYLLGGEYRTTNPGDQMSRPYARVAIMHVTLLLGALPVLLLGTPAAMVAILVLIKLCLDLYFHRRSHRSAGQAPGGEGDARKIET